MVSASYVLAALAPIPGHAVFLLLMQLALLLVVARLGAGVARLFGLPAVVGELASGIVLGPSVFGHYAPGAFAIVFPHESAQFQLLEVVGLLGMTLLLLLTGLETDLRLLKNLGRAALVASLMGMVVPFAMGFGLGLWMPDEYLAKPDQRMLFAAFLATAMAISAMPVIAKILMDLDLTKRNIGLVILSAGVVDDTAGWLVLSVIAGAATKGGQVHLAGLGVTLVSLAGFLLVMAFVIYPLLRLLFRLIDMRVRMPDTDLVLIVAITFVCAALTEHIGVHAVFGAFVCGTALRQVPHLSHETVHRLESFVFSILAPVFFGIVGLKVDLWTLSGGYMLGVVLGIACLGKLLGCTVGGLWGGMRLWEAVSIAVAMNARGAMELVVATIGLSLGILNQQMFSIIVVVAIVTSFLAPLALRITMRMVRMSEEEAKRIMLEESKGVFDPGRLRLLVPTAGGPHALTAARIALQMAKKSEHPPHVLFVEARSHWFDAFLRLFRRNNAGKHIDEHFSQIRALGNGVAPEIRTVTGDSAADTIVEEAQKGFDVILIGASGRGRSMGGGRILEDVVADAPCHVVIARQGANRPDHYSNIFVPFDGTTVSRVAAEFALRYAEAVQARITLAVLTELRPQAEDYAELASDAVLDRPSVLMGQALTEDIERRTQPPPLPGTRLPEVTIIPQDPDEELARVSPAFRASEVEARLQYLAYDPSHSALTEEIARGGYDLVVTGAENRAVQHRMFFGYENQRVIERSAVTTLIVVPKIGRLK